MPRKSHFSNSDDESPPPPLPSSEPPTLDDDSSNNKTQSGKYCGAHVISMVTIATVNNYFCTIMFVTCRRLDNAKKESSD